MTATHKIVFSGAHGGGGGAYHVVRLGEAVAGLEIRPYGTQADCCLRAEERATRHARKGSGGAKGRWTVERRGDSWHVVRAAVDGDGGSPGAAQDTSGDVSL